jgi:hypothetical protein
MSNPYLNLSLNPSLLKGDILTFPNPSPNPTRIEVITLDRTGKYVLKLPHASRNKDRKLDKKKKITNKHQTKFGPKSRKQRSPKHFWKGGKQEMEKLENLFNEVEKKYVKKKSYTLDSAGRKTKKSQ